MENDNNQRSQLEQDAKKASREILRQELREGLASLERTAGGLFLSALSGGLDIGFSLLLMGVMGTLYQGRMTEPAPQLLVGAAYAIGFIMVVLGRSELFTEQTTLAVLPVLAGHSTLPKLFRLWAIVYIANLIGAAAFARLITWVGPGLGVIDAGIFGQIAHRMIVPSAPILLLSAVLAGWLMGLLSWLVAAGRDTIGQIVIVAIITATIGVAHLHHVVVGSVEVFAGLFIGGDINTRDLVHFLLWATLGNIIGGTLFVAVIKYAHSILGRERETIDSETLRD